MAKELELKLQIKAEQLPNIIKDDLINSYRKGDWQRVNMDTLYYDTIDHDLRDKGIVLRIRKIDNTSYRQTLKLPGNSIAGLADRQEYEFEIEDDRLDLDKIPVTEVRNLLNNHKSDIASVFNTCFTRTQTELQIKNTRIELAIDIGAILSDGKELPINELELELLEGDVTVLFHLALTLCEKYTLQLKFAGKGERGYRLNALKEYKAKKLKMIELTKDCTCYGALQEIAKHTLAHWQSNHKAFCYSLKSLGMLHILDSCRRFSTLLHLFEVFIPSKIVNALQQQLISLQSELLSPCRMYQVHRLAPELVTDAELNAAYKEVQGLVDSTRYSQCLLSIGQWLVDDGWHNSLPQGQGQLLHKPAREYASQWLLKAIDDVDIKKLNEHNNTLIKAHYTAEWFTLPLHTPLGQLTSLVEHIQHLQAIQSIAKSKAITVDHSEKLASLNAQIKEAFIKLHQASTKC